MFREDKLTGARARARARTNTYADSVELSKLPKHIRDGIKSPERVKGVFRIGKHWLAVIGQDVALLNHVDEKSQKTIAFAAGEDVWSCQCNDYRDYYATWSMGIDSPARKGRKYAETVKQLPYEIAVLRQRCRQSKDRYRSCTNHSTYGRRRKHRREFGFHSSDRQDELPYVFEPAFHDRWDDQLEPKITTLAADAMQYGLWCRVGDSRKKCRVEVRCHASYGASSVHVHSISTSREKNLTIVSVTFDPFTWFVRVRGRIKPPRADIIPFSAFTLAGVEICAGIDAKFAAGRNDTSYNTTDARQMAIVFWSGGKLLTDLTAAERTALLELNMAFCMKHRIAARDLKVAAELKRQKNNSADSDEED